MSAQSVLQLQHQIGNQAVQRKLLLQQHPTQSSSANTVQRAVMVLQDPESETDPGLLADATTYHTAHGTGVLYDHRTDSVKADKNTQGDNHIDLFGHGHAGEIANFGESQLVDEIARKQQKLKLTAVNSVALHSCDSATPLTLEGETKQSVIEKYKTKVNTTLAERINQVYFNKGRYVPVSGFSGSVFTDSNGESRVLKSGKTEQAYKSARNHAQGKEAKIAVENEYLEPVDEKRRTYGRDKALMQLNLTDQYERNKGVGQSYENYMENLEDAEIAEAYDERTAWLKKEESDEPVWWSDEPDEVSEEERISKKG